MLGEATAGSVKKQKVIQLLFARTPPVRTLTWSAKLCRRCSASFPYKIELPRYPCLREVVEMNMELCLTH